MTASPTKPVIQRRKLHHASDFCHTEFTEILFEEVKTLLQIVNDYNNKIHSYILLSFMKILGIQLLVKNKNYYDNKSFVIISKDRVSKYFQ